MSGKEPAQTRTTPAATGSVGLLQRKCACGTHTFGGTECTACGKQRLQRRAG